MRGRKIRLVLFILILTSICVYALYGFIRKNIPRENEAVVRVGILHSLTGTMAVSEKPVSEAALLAIEEINKKGGVLGMKIEPVVADGKSDPEIFQKEAERLIAEEGVKVIFGCWTSASRKAVKPIVEKYNSLLFYPVQYEGLEKSPNIVYLGAAPNQQLIPAVKWARDNIGRRFFLVGSDYIFPRVANEICKNIMVYIDGEVIGEEYVPLGGEDFTEIAEKIGAAKPDVILNTINGSSNIAFFQAIHKHLTESGMSVMSLSITENEIDSFIRYYKERHLKEVEHFIEEHISKIYACWNYFESIDNALNADFKRRLKDKYGPGYRVNDPMEAAYFGVYLWSKAAGEAWDINDTQSVLGNLRQISVNTPEGIITIDDNNHSRKTVRVGRMNSSGDFDIVWDSKFPIEPVPFPYFKDIQYWKKFLYDPYREWGGHWESGTARHDSGAAL